jgi:hypothetical protein
VVRVENFVYAARELTGVRSTLCDRIHLFGSHIGIHGEASGGMRSDSAGFWKPERIVSGDLNRIS